MSPKILLHAALVVLTANFSSPPAQAAAQVGETEEIPEPCWRIEIHRPRFEVSEEVEWKLDHLKSTNEDLMELYEHDVPAIYGSTEKAVEAAVELTKVLRDAAVDLRATMPSGLLFERLQTLVLRTASPRAALSDAIRLAEASEVRASRLDRAVIFPDLLRSAEIITERLDTSSQVHKLWQNIVDFREIHSVMDDLQEIERRRREVSCSFSAYLMVRKNFEQARLLLYQRFCPTLAARKAAIANDTIEKCRGLDHWAVWDEKLTADLLVASSASGRERCARRRQDLFRLLKGMSGNRDSLEMQTDEDDIESPEEASDLSIENEILLQRAYHVES